MPGAPFAAQRQCMQTKICVQCKKNTVRNNASKVCSDECRVGLRRSGELRRAAETARIRRQKMGEIEYVSPHDMSQLKVGQKIAFNNEVGHILARVEIGESIGDVWQKQLDKHPILYDAQAPEPPYLPVSTVRYIVLIENGKRLAVKWPYLFNIKGVISHGSEEVESKASKETKAGEAG